MFNGLSDFYRSDEWRRFRQLVIDERTKDDGFVYDEVTGKPIVKAYDIILHHKEYLTEDNVFDYNISLNPDNIQIVSHKTHNQIHNKFGYKRKEIFLVYGAPLSGKNTYVEDVAEAGDLIVDIDSIWQCVSGQPRYIKPKRLNAVVFGVRDKLMECVKYRIGKWNCCYIVGGFPLISERERLVKELGAREIYIECTKEECLRRLEESSNGRDKDEWKKYIAQWFDRYTPPVL